MRKKNFKGRCEKRKLSKCEGVCKTYDALQYAYADMLEADNDIVEIRCNVQLEGMDYTNSRKTLSQVPRTLAVPSGSSPVQSSGQEWSKTQNA